MSDREGRLDAFESVFRSADKARFHLARVVFRSACVITDRSATEAAQRLREVRRFLGTLGVEREVEWSVLAGADFAGIGELRQTLLDRGVDLIVTWRNLHDPLEQGVHSLGAFVDELTQEFDARVILMPDDPPVPEKPIQRVMVVTDHLTGEDRLVNKGIHFAPEGGRLFLCHIEDDSTFNRYIRAIERIPDLNTQIARERLREQLLKEPSDYIGSCQDVIAANRLPISVEAIVRFGHRLTDYRELVNEQDIDLLIFNTRDEKQVAMQGLAYSLAVELRELPLLML